MILDTTSHLDSYRHLKMKPMEKVEYMFEKKNDLGLYVIK